MSENKDIECGPRCLHEMGGYLQSRQQTRAVAPTTIPGNETDPLNADSLEAAFRWIAMQVIASAVVLAIYWNAQSSCDVQALKIWVAVFTGHSALYASLANYMFRNRSWLKENRNVDARLKSVCATIEITGLVCFLVGNYLVWSPGRMCPSSPIWVLSVVLLAICYLQLLCIVLPLLIVTVTAFFYCLCCWKADADVRITIQGLPLPAPRAEASRTEYTAVNNEGNRQLHLAGGVAGACFLLGACCTLWLCCVCCVAVLGAGTQAQARNRSRRRNRV